MIRRIQRLEAQLGRRVTVEDMTDDELAAIATRGRITRAEVLTDAELERIRGTTEREANGEVGEPNRGH